ncbi:MAG: M6 family metalloprotease domain-containing protein [Muribaculaceae bacterium]|nr:M6 family metalloprotease domain-containing protein [Muribaculaceae bacterium]
MNFKYSENFKCRNVWRSFTAGAFFCLAAVSALAVPAKPGLMTYTDADGHSIELRLVGDERFHQYFTPEGLPVAEKDGRWFYSDIDQEGLLVISDVNAATSAVAPAIDIKGLPERMAKRAALSPKFNADSRKFSHLKAQYSASGNVQSPYPMGPGLFPDLHFPSCGDQKAIVILVEYQDVKFSDPYRNNVTAHDYFNRMLNEDNFSDYGATGSAAQFFRENSNNVFRPEFDLYGPLTLAHERKYYGANDRYGDDIAAHEMVIEACEQLDDVIDFTEYDRDGDGIVDNVFLFYAGKGEASGGGRDTVWPHSFNLDDAGYPDVYFDGVKIYTYGVTCEWEGNRPDGVGTFVHEFSHVMGLPDLYATNYASSFTPGAYSTLDSGPYNNDGMTPPMYGAFERYALGWVAPKVLDNPGDVVLKPIAENECAIIPTDKDSEFFLLENRQQKGWDKYIPGHGMLIWHIDYVNKIWQNNSVNNSSSHQYVDIEEADNIKTSASQSGDTFPGVKNITSFTSSTAPGLVAWNGVGINRPITDIAETPEGNITFRVGGEMSKVDTIATAAGEISVSGRSVTSVSGSRMIVYNAAGQQVCVAHGSIELPGAGLYIIADGKNTIKVIVK